MNDILSIAAKDPNPSHAARYIRQYGLFENVLKVREAMLREGFWDQETVNRFAVLFQQFIDIIKYDYDPITNSILFKIKKTTVKKMPNYRAEAMFYYNAVGNAIMILLKEYKDKIIFCLGRYFDKETNIYELYSDIVSNSMYMYNLTNVQCIYDNIVQVVL